MAKIGLYGGSFNPVHLAHLMVAQAAMEEAGLDRLIFIPAARSPFKPHQDVAPDAIRLKLLRLALAGLPHCEIDQQELERGGTSYTIDTVRNYRDRHPSAELFYLIGADHVPLLPKWRDAGDLARSLHFLAIPRPGEEPVPFPAPYKGAYLRGVPTGISSSLIRDRLKAQLPIDLLTTREVAAEIRNNRLYL